MTAHDREVERLIKRLVESTGALDAQEAVRRQAQELINLFVSLFGPLTPPVNVDVLASLRGIQKSDESPLHSDDAELAPDAFGRVVMRVNADRPETRQRFSVAHEISHTFFPDYESKIWCRSDGRYVHRSSSADRLETLCDFGAAELLFPEP